MKWQETGKAGRYARVRDDRPHQGPWKVFLQPAMVPAGGSIGGHMHEHFGKHAMGKTIAINAGFGPGVNVWLEAAGNRTVKLEFWGEH